MGYICDIYGSRYDVYMIWWVMHAHERGEGSLLRPARVTCHLLYLMDLYEYEYEWL
jgi:hypothetical protein